MKPPICDVNGKLILYVDKPVSGSNTLISQCVFEGEHLQGLCLEVPCSLEPGDRVTISKDYEVRVYRSGRLIALGPMTGSVTKVAES